MEIFNSINSIFGNIEERELTEVEKVQYLEDILKEGLRDLAFTRDDVYVEALQENTIFMIRAGQDKLKKFKSDDNMYISIPSTLYDEIKDLSDFDQYHKVLDTAMLTMAAKEYREQDEDGTVIGEAELIHNAVEKIKNINGEVLDIEDEIEYDDYGQPVKIKDDKTFFEPKKFTKIKPDGEKEKDEDDEAADEASESSEDEDEGESDGDGDDSKTSKDNGTCNLQEINDDIEKEKEDIQNQIEQREYKSEYTSQSITDTEQKVVDNVKKSKFYINKYDSTSKILKAKTIVALNKYVKDIAKELRGYNGKTKKYNPSKRLSSKDICSDISDKFYIGKSYVDGKFIDQNIVVDCSGSMSGSPIEDAIKLCYVFNKLAQEGLLEGHIILTETSENMKLEMPVHDEVIKKLGGTGGGEGLTKTLKKHKDVLRGKNVIVMTDGDLVEEPIPDKFWDKGRMNCVGMYINKSVKAENLPGYDKGMSRWFPKTIIRNSFEEAVQKLLQLGLKASKK